jgi:hypothetical protein
VLRPPLLRELQARGDLLDVQVLVGRQYDDWPDVDAEGVVLARLAAVEDLRVVLEVFRGDLGEPSETS